MSLVVPNTAKKSNVEDILNENLTLKLYSNDKIPGATDTAASYTETSGGGYVARTLVAGSWTATDASPSVATYVFQDFNFTGAVSGTGAVYGYYVVNSLGALKWAERFPEAVLPFIPVNGSLIRINPRFVLAQG